jgi:hypothetical protein
MNLDITPAAYPVHRPGAAASDGAEIPSGGAPRYCPTRLLADFALLMAGHGRCANTSLMLGDAEYAMWQLTCARALDDPELCALADRLAGYFDDPQHTSLPVLGIA